MEMLPFARSWARQTDKRIVTRVVGVARKHIVSVTPGSEPTQSFIATLEPVGVLDDSTGTVESCTYLVEGSVNDIIDYINHPDGKATPFLSAVKAAIEGIEGHEPKD